MIIWAVQKFYFSDIEITDHVTIAAIVTDIIPILMFCLRIDVFSPKVG